jgi:hypothetical protein
MRALLVLAVAIVPLHAWAFDGPKAAQEFDVAVGNCQTGQDESGKEFTKAEWDKVCAKRDRLAGELKAHKWCWDRSEVEWYPCKFTSFVDYATRIPVPRSKAQEE